MDYSLLKTIETPIGYFDPLQSILQSPYQSLDFINPGLGGLAKLFDVFVPIPSFKPPHCSDKTNVNQQGFGSTLTSDRIDEPNIQNSQQESEQQKVSSSLEVNSDPKYLINDNQGAKAGAEKVAIEENEVDKLNNQDKKRKLGNDVFEAFLHPLVKTAKISLKSARSERSSKNFGSDNLEKAAQLSVNQISKVPSAARPSQKSTTVKHKFKVI